MTTPDPASVQEGVREAVDHWLWNHDFTTRDLISDAVRKAFTKWLDDNLDPEALNRGPAPIPAAPGWYVQKRSKTPDELDLDPIIAWQPEGTPGLPSLLPYIHIGDGYPPTALSAENLADDKARIVYLPNHDPDDRSPRYQEPVF